MILLSMDLKKLGKPGVLLGVLGTSSAMIFIRVTESPALTVLFYRLLFTLAIISVPIVIDSCRGKLNIINEFKGNYKNFLLLSLLITVAMTTWIFAVRNTSIASAVILSNTHPIIILFVSVVFLKIKFHRNAIIGVFITMFGCAAMSANDYLSGGNHIVGDILAVTTATFFGLYILAASRTRKKYRIDVYLFITFALALIYTTILAICFREPLLPASSGELFILFCMALFSSVLGRCLVDWGLRYVSPQFASLAFLTENLYAIVLGMIFVSEFPSAGQLICGAVLIFGLVIYNKYE